MASTNILFNRFEGSFRKIYETGGILSLEDHENICPHLSADEMMQILAADSAVTFAAPALIIANCYWVVEYDPVCRLYRIVRLSADLTEGVHFSQAAVNYALDNWPEELRF